MAVGEELPDVGRSPREIRDIEGLKQIVDDIGEAIQVGDPRPHEAWRPSEALIHGRRLWHFRLGANRVKLTTEDNEDGIGVMPFVRIAAHNTQTAETSEIILLQSPGPESSVDAGITRYESEEGAAISPYDLLSCRVAVQPGDLAYAAENWVQVALYHHAELRQQLALLSTD